MDRNDANNRAYKRRGYKPNRRTFAAKYNSRVLAALQQELEIHPEKDISTILSASYSRKLEEIKEHAKSSNTLAKPLKEFPKADVRSRLCAEDEASFLHGPSTTLQELLLPVNGSEDEGPNKGGNGADDTTQPPLAEMVMDILDDAEILYEGVWAGSRMVFRLNDSLVAKFAEEESAVDEYHALEFLRDRLPEFPAPRPHGVIAFGCYGILFTDFMAGHGLARQWPQMSPGQKKNVSGQLDVLFTNLRSLPLPHDTPLGALQSGGRCRDGRRQIRCNTEPIRTVQDFEGWIFSGSKFAQPVFIKFLQSLLPQPAKEPVLMFTHGDLRQENIIVKRRDGRDGCDDAWEIVAVVDWETSGFYPEYWESVKMTNCMMSIEKNDWYNYLPDCVSPQRYAVQWAVDRVWDPCT